MNNKVDFCERRDGTEHQETVVLSRAFCRVCGFIDKGRADIYYHGDSYGLDDSDLDDRYAEIRPDKIRDTDRRAKRRSKHRGRDDDE